MRQLRRLLPLLLLPFLIVGPSALSVAPPKEPAKKKKAPARPEPPDKDTLEKIEKRAEELQRAIANLRKLGARDPALADIEVYHKAVAWLLKHEEFYHKDTAAWALAVLDRGLLRASQQGRGRAPWFLQTGTPVVRAYRSGVDGSVQPYVVTYPHDYGKDKTRRYRVDLVLHGRNDQMTEVDFLYRHRGHEDAPLDLDHVRLDVYGR